MGIDMQQPSPDRLIAYFKRSSRMYATFFTTFSRIAIYKGRDDLSEDGSKSSCTSCAVIMKMRANKTKHLQKPREPVMGIEPMTPVLPRLCATSAPHGQAWFGWAVRDSNPRSRRQLIYSQPHLAT